MSNAMPGTDAARAASASDEVIDAIAEIEMRRREAEKEGGLAASCASALRKLHELLDRETETRRQSGTAGQPGNVEAVAAEIERLKKRAPAMGQGPAARNAFPDGKKASWQDARRNPARNKGRRTMGRAGGR